MLPMLPMLPALVSPESKHVQISKNGRHFRQDHDEDPDPRVMNSEGTCSKQTQYKVQGLPSWIKDQGLLFLTDLTALQCLCMRVCVRFAIC